MINFYWPHRIKWIMGNVISYSSYIQFSRVDVSLFFLPSLQKTSKLMEKLRKTQELFNQLCQVAKELDSLYSIQALMILFNGFITLTFQFFFLIYNVSNEPILGEDFSYFHTIELLQQIVTIFIMLRAANSPVTEVRCCSSVKILKLKSFCCWLQYFHRQSLTHKQFQHEWMQKWALKW